MIKRIVLSGGSIKSISFIGALKSLEENKILKNVNMYLGSSGGSIIAFLMCIGFTVDEAFIKCKELCQIYNQHVFDTEAIFYFVSTFGIDDGDVFTNWMKEVINLKFKMDDVSFIDFCKITGKNLVVFASNISKNKLDVFSVDDSPNISVVTAIRASISIPFILTPVIINDDMYVDSGLLNNFPIDYIETSIAEDTLGIYINCPPEKINSKPNIVNYIHMILSTIISNITIRRDKMRFKLLCIHFEEKPDQFLNFNFETFRFNVSDKEIEEYYLTGYKSANKFIEETALAKQ